MAQFKVILNFLSLVGCFIAFINYFTVRDPIVSISLLCFILAVYFIQKAVKIKPSEEREKVVGSK